MYLQVSNGAECVLIKKSWFLQHATEATLRKLRHQVSYYRLLEKIRQVLKPLIWTSSLLGRLGGMVPADNFEIYRIRKVTIDLDGKRMRRANRCATVSPLAIAALDLTTSTSLSTSFLPVVDYEGGSWKKIGVTFLLSNACKQDVKSRICTHLVYTRTPI